MARLEPLPKPDRPPACTIRTLIDDDETLRCHLLDAVRALEEVRPLLTQRDADEAAKVEQALADLFGLVARLEAGEWLGRSVED